MAKTCCICGKTALPASELCLEHEALRAASQALLWGNNPTPDGVALPPFEEAREGVAA